MVKWQNTPIPRNLMDEIKKYIEEHSTLGYTSAPQFIAAAVRDKLESAEEQKQIPKLQEKITKLESWMKKYEPIINKLNKLIEDEETDNLKEVIKGLDRDKLKKIGELLKKDGG